MNRPPPGYRPGALPLSYRPSRPRPVKGQPGFFGNPSGSGSGYNWIQTNVGLPHRVYSPTPLFTRPCTHRRNRHPEAPPPYPPSPPTPLCPGGGLNSRPIGFQPITLPTELPEPTKVPAPFYHPPPTASDGFEPTTKELTAPCSTPELRSPTRNSTPFRLNFAAAATGRIKRFELSTPATTTQCSTPELYPPFPVELPPSPAKARSSSIRLQRPTPYFFNLLIFYPSLLVS